MSQVGVGALTPLYHSPREEIWSEVHVIDESALPIDTRTLAALREALQQSPVIVELKLGQRAEPERLFFYRYELLVDYLRMIARPGDTVTAWRFDTVCTEDNALVRASAPRP